MDHDYSALAESAIYHNLEFQNSAIELTLHPRTQKRSEMHEDILGLLYKLLIIPSCNIIYIFPVQSYASQHSAYVIIFCGNYKMQGVVCT